MEYTDPVTVADVNRIAGVINAVSKQNGSFYGAFALCLAYALCLIGYSGASDSRKNGIAAGY